MRPATTATLLTHRRPGDTRHVLERLLRIAGEHGVTLRVPPDEVEKHGCLAEEPGRVAVVEDEELEAVDLCVVLGGDGTILTALRRYAGTGVPVFAVNFGEVGFLATMDPGPEDRGLERAFSGDFDVLHLPGIELRAPREAAHPLGLNDASVHRRHGGRVAQLAYAVGEDEVGHVACDGLVVSTPAGSTGYNLANGGPVLAWGVEGYVVSFIAPHSLAARPLVVAPNDEITVRNRSRDEPVDLLVDGRPAGDLQPGEAVRLRFRPDTGALAQVPGATFYHRLRQKFGLLAQ